MKSYKKKNMSDSIFLFILIEGFLLSSTEEKRTKKNQVVCMYHWHDSIKFQWKKRSSMRSDSCNKKSINFFYTFVMEISLKDNDYQYVLRLFNRTLNRITTVLIRKKKKKKHVVILSFTLFLSCTEKHKVNKRKYNVYCSIFFFKRCFLFQSVWVFPSWDEKGKNSFFR